MRASTLSLISRIARGGDPEYLKDQKEWWMRKGVQPVFIGTNDPNEKTRQDFLLLASQILEED